MSDPTTTSHATQPPGAPATLIKGSWEEKLIRGQQLIAAQNDEAIGLLQSLIDRLANLPESQRRAANQRLDRILLQAITDLVFYLTYRDRYTEALANTALAARLSAPEHSVVWQQHSAALLLQSGDLDAAFALLDRIARAGDITHWHDLVMNALRHHRLDVAQAALGETERTVNRAIATLSDEQEMRQARAQLAYLKAHVVLEQGKIEECMAWAQYAMAASDFFSSNPGYFYIQLVDRGYYREALTLIHYDQTNPIRAGFWGGLALYRRGEHEQAEQRWRQALRAPLPDQGPTDFLELVMTHYYLGDKEGRGLASVLGDLQQQQDVAFGQLFLAGLGWALRNDRTAAHSNFRLAVMRPHFWWAFCADLLPATEQDEYARYFADATSTLAGKPFKGSDG
jgi:tetratricopeptide (TPR) repeat protein